jgi:hypothetical protein
MSDQLLKQFLDKQFCKKLPGCNFFAIRLTMLILSLNVVDIQIILEFRNSFENIVQSFLKILKGRFFEHPIHI